jgi:hypothetical protein
MFVERKVQDLADLMVSAQSVQIRGQSADVHRDFLYLILMIHTEAANQISDTGLCRRCAKCPRRL